jgi:hypothetical protein
LGSIEGGHARTFRGKAGSLLAAGFACGDAEEQQIPCGDDQVQKQIPSLRFGMTTQTWNDKPDSE